MNLTNPISGMARLYEILAHIKVYPVPVRPVAIASGVREQDMSEALASSSFKVVNDHIYQKTDIIRLESLTVGDALYLYESNQLSLYCTDGRPVRVFVDGYEDSSRMFTNVLAWKFAGMLDHYTREDKTHEGL